ncbi:MAG: hypothetical protein JWM68_94, partial [Verrucomicrobiales bacterium]|nr:hypothetical protein [Verrucomicrobiales bacterium]
MFSPPICFFPRPKRHSPKGLVFKQRGYLL